MAFDYEGYISNKIKEMENSSISCDDWNEFSDIYKDTYGVRPHMDFMVEHGITILSD